MYSLVRSRGNKIMRNIATYDWFVSSNIRRGSRTFFGMHSSVEFRPLCGRFFVWKRKFTKNPWSRSAYDTELRKWISIEGTTNTTRRRRYANSPHVQDNGNYPSNSFPVSSFPYLLFLFSLSSFFFSLIFKNCSITSFAPFFCGLFSSV